MTSADLLLGRDGAALTEAERGFLHRSMVPFAGLKSPAVMSGLAVLLDPAKHSLAAHGYHNKVITSRVLHAVMRGSAHLGTVPQSWSIAEWIEVVQLFGGTQNLALTVVAVRGYGAPLRHGDNALYRNLHRIALARKLYGRPAVDAECRRVREALARIGYRLESHVGLVNLCVAELLLWHDSASLDAVTDETLTACPMQAGSRKARHRVGIALVQLGIVRHGMVRDMLPPDATRPDRLGVSEEWFHWVERWIAASIKSEASKRRNFAELMTAGRWLARCHPTVTSPAGWTLDLVIEYVRHVDQRRVGDDIAVPRRTRLLGEPLAPGSKLSLLTSARVFFKDLYDWGWIPRRFDPDRGFAAPRHVMRGLHVKPRPIDDGYWFKLRAAALALRPDDLPNHKRPGRYQYPFELTRAVAVAWAFSGCRANEIARLEMDCIYVEHVPEQTDPATGQVVAPFKQYMLRVPVNKTQDEFVKPVEEPLALAVDAWKLVRPPQAKLLDRTTGRLTDHLFCYRGQRIGIDYLNGSVISILLRKAGLPPQDTRGLITSHRGRATLATKLYNSASGLTSLQVMKWLGHRNLASGQHYIEITPIHLMTAFHLSTKLSEELRCVSVLVDTRPGLGDPVFRYDLGHGWCTNPAYAACAHRMACARCAFYEPADTFEGALTSQNDRFVRMLQRLDLTENERAAITGDAEAVNHLLARLADTPPPGSDHASGQPPLGNQHSRCPKNSGATGHPAGGKAAAVSVAEEEVLLD